MSAIEFKLDAFEGPLDLLLFLVNRHKLNIYDIEISLLLEQYLEYIDGMEEEDFDQAGEFLAMAARLVYIKTCSLLPKAEEAEELKKELEGELIEYSMCREAAARLKELCVYGDVFVRPPEKLPVNKVFTGNIDPQKLVKAYLGMSAKARSMKPVRAEQFDPIVTSRIVTVTSKIVHVLKMLYSRGSCPMSELYDGVEDKSARVATFLAVLELTKSGRVMLSDDNSEIRFNRDSPRRKTAARRTEEQQSAEKAEPVNVQPEKIEAAAPAEENRAEKSGHTDDVPAVVMLSPARAERYVGAARTGVDKVLAIETEPPEKTVQNKHIDPPESEMIAETEAGEIIPENVSSEDFTENVPLNEAEEETTETAEEIKETADHSETEQAAESEHSAETVEETETEAFEEIGESGYFGENAEEDKYKNNHGRANRFACRFYWGYPLESGNCLPYRRERL